MRRTILLSVAVCMFISGVSFADTFAEGTANEFEIDFVTISGDNGDLGNWSAGSNYTFSGVNHGAYRMGTYEITNDQWTNFKNEYGTVTGSPSYAYNENPYWTGTNVPTNRVSLYEAAQFVNYLNTSKGYQAAYNFTGTQGQSDYTMSVWDVTQTDGTNLYRHKDAHYFLPTEDEWVKAGYWNGTNLQTYATVGDVTPTQAGWNYFYGGSYATDPYGPWDVGDGTEELNGTYDMMGNISEWIESPYYSGDYLSSSGRGFRGGSHFGLVDNLRSSFRGYAEPHIEGDRVGFRVASIPEPCTLLLFGLGTLALRLKHN